MTRIRAFLTHLFVSATVVGVVVAVTFFIWYPDPYWFVNGADKILLMLIAVDVVIGPFLTLVVFKPGKPGLKMDMTAIIVVQIAALLYGSLTLYWERPLFIVFAVDRFEVVTASEIDTRKLKYPQLKNLPLSGPGVAVARRPRDRALAQKIMQEVLFHRAPDIDRRPELYEPLSSHIDNIVAKSRSPDTLRLNQAEQEKVHALLERHNAQLTEFAFIPLIGKVPDREILLAVDKTTALPFDALRIDPWRRNTPAAKQRNK